MPARSAKRRSSRPKAESRRARAPRLARGALSSWLLGCVLVAAGAWAYATSFEGSFVFDDTPGIIENPNIRRLWPLTAAMSAPDEVTLSGRPIASLSFALNYALAPQDVRDVMALGRPGDPPGGAARFLRNIWGYHFTNLLIHLVAGLALFGVVRRTLLSDRLRDRFGRAATPLAFLVALLWIVHPLQTESVTYLVQRVEALMGMFFLLTVYCSIRRSGVPRFRGSGFAGSGFWWRVAAVVCCALGMGSKEVMVAAPIIVVLWDWTFGSARSGVASAQGPEPSARSQVPFYLALFSTWIILFALVAAERRPHSVGVTQSGWTPWTYLLTQAEVIIHYLRLAVFPDSIVIDYGWPQVTSLAAVWPEGLALVAVVALTVVAIVRRHPTGFLGAWFFLILAPTSSVLPIFTEIAAEHRMYLPLAAVLASVVIGAFEAGRRLTGRIPALAERRQVVGVAGIAAAVAVAMVSVALTRDRNLDYRTEEALWRDAVQKRPRNARARVSFGIQLHAAGRGPEAEAQLRTAIDLDATNAPAHVNLGAVLCTAGKFDEGISHLERALALDPGLTQAYGNLGEAYASQGRTALAVKYFSLAVERRSDDPFLLNRLAWLLATATEPELRNGPRAAELAERAVRLTTGRDVVSLDSLAAAYAELGRMPEAIVAATDALQRARASGRSEIISEIEARLALYRAGRKFRCVTNGVCSSEASR